MTDETTVPKAECILLSGSVYKWKVLSCPYCGESHRHGAGSELGKVRSMLGHRFTHCSQGPGVGSVGYELIEKGAK